VQKKTEIKKKKMQLENTKTILDRLIARNSESLKRSLKDIKPAYSQNEVRSGYGYIYNGIEEVDQNFIYLSLDSLDYYINEITSPFRFNLDYFVTVENIVKELESAFDDLEINFIQLKLIKEKYKSTDSTKYPTTVVLNYYTGILEVLNQIKNSKEFIEFKEVGIIEKLKSENTNLKFDKYWGKRKWIYISHLLLFLPFLIIASWIIISKDSKNYFGYTKTSIILISGLITIFFNLFFNNHSSFKDSWKLLTKSGREKLIRQEKEKFNKSTSS
jgi:hypothetical protein